MTDMLKLLKIVDKVEKPVMLNEAVSLNISANGDCPDDITSILGKLVNLSNPSTSTQDKTLHGGHKDAMMSTIANVDSYADQAAHEYADKMGEEYANEPNPEVSDVEYMTKDLAGGLNKPKKQFKKEYPGDNPMTMEEARANELMREYKAIKEGRIDELSPATLGSYIKKASRSMASNAQRGGYSDAKGDHETGTKVYKKAHNRQQGIAKAVNKITGEATDPRDSRPQTWRPNNTGYAWDRLDTRLPSHPKHSAKAKAGQQAGLKSNIKRDLGSHGPKGHLPEDQVKEVGDTEAGKKALGSYINKSAASLGKAGYKAGSTDGTAAKLDPHIHTINKRSAGIKRATDRLTRESTDKKPTDDAKKKKSEKMKAYRADRDKNGED